MTKIKNSSRVIQKDEGCSLGYIPICTLHTKRNRTNADNTLYSYDAHEDASSSPLVDTN